MTPLTILTPELDLILDAVCVPAASAGPITGRTIQVAKAQHRAVLSVVRAAVRLRGPEGLTDKPLVALDRALKRLAKASGGGR